MKILITGATGFAGKHLVENFIKTSGGNHEIYGIHRHSNLQESPEIKLFECDINYFSCVKKILRLIKPDQIFQFAAHVSVQKSFENPQAVLNTNILGTVNLLEAAREVCDNAKILIPGSAEEYGNVKNKYMPISEDVPLNPSNPYGISKATQELLGKYYFETYGMHVYLTRTFHYSGPGQPLGFVCSDFAKQIADIEKENKKCIRVGNLKAKRDFLDIRDVIRAYINIIEKGNHGSPYNVCRGKSISIEKILEILINNSKSRVKMVVDKEKLRPIDVPDFVGDNSKLKKDTKWYPSIRIEKTLEDVLDFWRNKN